MSARNIPSRRRPAAIPDTIADLADEHCRLINLANEGATSDNEVHRLSDMASALLDRIARKRATSRADMKVKLLLAMYDGRDGGSDCGRRLQLSLLKDLEAQVSPALRDYCEPELHTARLAA